MFVLFARTKIRVLVGLSLNRGTIGECELVKRKHNINISCQNQNPTSKNKLGSVWKEKERGRNFKREHSDCKKINGCPILTGELCQPNRSNSACDVFEQRAPFKNIH